MNNHRFPNTDLLQRYSSDCGLFGPTSYRWNQFAYISRRLALLSASILQVTHPVIGQAVSQTNLYKTQPMSRTLAIIRFLDNLIYGRTETWIGACEKLWNLHQQIKIQYDGKTYYATEPKLLRWVWLTTVVMEMQFMPMCVELTEYNVDKIYEEYKLIALACGILPSDIPDSLMEMERIYHDFLNTEIKVTDTARTIAQAVFHLPSSATAELTSKQWTEQLYFLLGPLDYYCHLFAKALLPEQIRTALQVTYTKEEHQRFKRWCRRLQWFNKTMPARITKSETNLNAMAGDLL